MEQDQFLGYSKPLLNVAGDSIVVSNLPVPQSAVGVRGWLARHRGPIGSLRGVQFAQRLKRRMRGAIPPGSADGVAEVRVIVTVERIVADLARRRTERGSQLLLVLLPTAYELNDRPSAAALWTDRLSAIATRLDVGYLDLFPVVRRMDPAEQRALYLQESNVDFPSAAGHYTVEGNALVAREILAYLRAAGWLESPRS
jgi:hypothetical protein